MRKQLTDAEAAAEAFINGAGASAASTSASSASAASSAAASGDKPKGKGKKERVMIQFDEKVLERVDTAAERRGISRSAWVQYVVSRALDQGEG